MSTAEQGLHIRNSKVVTFTFTEGKIFNFFNNAPYSNMSLPVLIPCVPLRPRSTNFLSYLPLCITTTLICIQCLQERKGIYPGRGKLGGNVWTVET